MQIIEREGEEPSQLLRIGAPGVGFCHWFNVACLSAVDTPADPV